MLLPIYLDALAHCAPELLAARTLTSSMPRDVVAIGKCAGALFDGVASHARSAFVAIPEGYRLPAATAMPVEVMVGGHPDYTAASFEAGKRLVDFVERHDDVLFLISGGGSACVEMPLPPFSAEDLIAANRRLVASGIPIGAINTVRKHLSAIKGGKLSARVRGRSVTLIHSDVSRGALADVASAPTIGDGSTNARAADILDRIGGCEAIARTLRELPDPHSPERSSDVHLLADNDTLVTAAAASARERGLRPVTLPDAVDEDVESAARMLAARAARLSPGEILVAGGEVTVVVTGGGRGGRCSELAVRFALHAPPGTKALFAGSDGLDGNSGVAGIELDAVPRELDRHTIATELSASNSFTPASALGRAIIIPPAGNNLRDLYLLARG